jgi:isocitrate dehydrogenase (NAD+)
VLLSALLMLRHLGEGATAARVRRALDRVLLSGQVRTRDLGGSASTTEFAGAIIEALK